jgi:hypothetical protein
MICKTFAGDESFFQGESRVNVAFKKSLRGNYCSRREPPGRFASWVQLPWLGSKTTVVDR